MDNQKEIKVLNDLVAKSYDAEKGYQEAREQVDDTRLMNLFQDLSRQRYDFGHELKSMIERLGGEVDKGSTIASELHRAFMDIKAKTSNNTEKLILEEVVRGEENAISNYESALEELERGSDSYAIVESQLSKIKSMENRMEALENVFA
jgi:uncharacterized protein (TIGR02284 family)